MVTRLLVALLLLACLPSSATIKLLSGKPSTAVASFRLDGVNEDIRSTNTATALMDSLPCCDNGTNEYTWIVWFKADDDTPAGRQGIFGSTSGTRNYHLSLMTDGRLRFSWTTSFGFTTRWYDTTDPISGTGWHSLCLGYTNNAGSGWSSKMWIDGVQAGDRPAGASYTTVQWTANPLTLGSSEGAFFDGNLMQFAFYGTRLTDEQCASVHALGGSANYTSAFGQPIFYLRGQVTDDAVTAGGVRNLGSSAELFSGSNMETGDIDPLETP